MAKATRRGCCRTQYHLNFRIFAGIFCSFATTVRRLRITFKLQYTHINARVNMSRTRRFALRYSACDESSAAPPAKDRFRRGFGETNTSAGPNDIMRLAEPKERCRDAVIRALPSAGE